jgi:DNA polymerase iota
MSYYDDLSVGSSDDYGSCFEDDHSEKEDGGGGSEELDGDNEWFLAAAAGGNKKRSSSTRSELSSSSSLKSFATLATGLWSRCILYLDVDCFYCQCEEIDRNLRNTTDKNEPIRPLAIGQKHIIVTCNYAARKYGVQKLQSREAAYAACPHLWIVEGSDLIQYRRHSRAIYEAFRNAMQEISEELHGLRIPAKKGCMDEMMADLTLAVEQIILIQDQRKKRDKKQYDKEQTRFVFGEDAPSSMAILVEDQTGEKSIVSFQPSTTGGASAALDPQETSLALSRRNIHNTCGASDQDQFDCRRRLEIAADLTERICHYIRQRTGFHTTGGLSVSPLLAKLASGLHKPKSVNLLFPWRSSQLLYAMPLRKMHNIGHGTMKALEKEMIAIDDFGGRVGNSGGLKSGVGEERKMRTVCDLLEMPRSSIRQAVQGLAAFQADASSEEQCNLLIQHCRGLDTTEIVDDEGRLPKTVSVENSFRRGTIQTLEAVKQALEDLYRRLPLLLQDRASWAADPQKAYPITIRLTIRMVDPQLALVKKRRPYVTKSKQSSIDGKRYLVQESDLQVQTKNIRRHIKPLLQQLLPSVINVTRINIAVTNFQDISLAQATSTESTRASGQVSLLESLDRKRSSSQSRSQLSQSMSQNIGSMSGQKRLRLLSGNDSSVVGPTRVSPGTNLLTTDGKQTPSKLNARGYKSLHAGRMKSTRIDHFFFKK